MVDWLLVRMLASCLPLTLQSALSLVTTIIYLWISVLRKKHNRPWTHSMASKGLGVARFECGVLTIG